MLLKRLYLFSIIAIIKLFNFFYNIYPKIECSLGYHLPGCNVPCPFPNYGYDCQSECTSCTEENCNHITGCPEISNVYLY